MNFYYLRKIAAKRTLQSEAEKIRAKENPTDEEITMLDQLDTLIETSDPMDLIHAKQEVELINMAKQQQEITDRDNFIEQYGEEAYMKYKAQEAIEEQMVLKTSRTPNYQQMKIKVNDIQRLYPNVNIELAQNYENLSADEKSYIAEKSYGENIKGYYNPKTDKVVIFADNIKNQAELEKTFAHETAGHKGLEVLLGNDYNTVLDEIYQEAQKTHAAELQKIAQTYGKDLENSADQKYVLEEFLANQADLEKASFFKSLVQKIKMALRKCGFNAKWTDNEIKTLLRRSLAKQQRERKGTGTNGVRFSIIGEEGANIEQVNINFNEDIDRQITGNLPNGYIYQLGTPGNILLSTGIPNLPIELSARQLKAKAETAHHPFNIEDIKNLPLMLQNPIGVFLYGDKKKAQNIIIEVQKDGKNFIVGISLNFQHDGLIVNSIRGLYPKDLHEWLTWIQDGKSLYLNKEKIQNLINQQRRNLADVEYINLDSISNIIESFENPSLETEKNQENLRFSIAPDEKAPVLEVDWKKEEKPTPEDFNSEPYYFLNEESDIESYRNELEDIFINFGTRKKGVKKFISVHYAGLRNPVTALEVLNIGDVIRRGKITEEGNSDYPTSRRYELQAEDGAMLKVIIDFNRKNDKNKSVINFYSDRESDPRGQASSGGITDLKNTLPQNTEKSSAESEKNQEKSSSCQFFYFG